MTRPSNLHFTEKHIPSELQVKVRHFHPGNSSNTKRHGKVYRTIAKLIDRESGAELAKGEAKCCDTDSPRRRVGREVAIGRALKNYYSMRGMLPPF